MLNVNLKKFGDGEIVKFDNEYYMYKLSSFKNNPLLKPDEVGLIWEESGNKKIGAIFNGGAEIFENKILLAPRCHKNYYKTKWFDPKLGFERVILENYVSEVWFFQSQDGEKYEKLDELIIRGDGTDHSDFIYGIEDVRIFKTKERYFLIGCGKIKAPFKGEGADRVAIYSTTDFKKIVYHGIIPSFDSRNAVLLEHDKGYYLFLRFHPNIYLVRLDDIDLLLDAKYNKNFWDRIYEDKEKYFFLGIGDFLHEKEKIGPGTQLILTNEGWLFIYHAVGNISKEICNQYGLPEKIDRGYSINIALLDYDNPKRIIARSKFPIYIPNKPYELYGDNKYPIDVPAVVFPVGAIVIENKLFIYAGSGDKYEILLNCDIESLLDFLCRYYKK